MESIKNPGASLGVNLRQESGVQNRRSRNVPSRMGVPTPMLLGNHVLGDGNMLTRASRALSPNRVKYDPTTSTLESKQPRSGLRRTPLQPTQESQ